MTSIEWTDKTWNPIVGCSIVSPGCTNCYAMKLAGRRLKNTAKYKGLTKPSKAGPVWTGEVRLWEPALLQPLRTKKPCMWFVNSEGDLFHEDIPDEWIDRVFAVMALCPQHIFQVLTKRAERMRRYCANAGMPLRIAAEGGELERYLPVASGGWTLGNYVRADLDVRELFPLPNVWLGISCERQQEADERIPLLLQTPAAIRFISAEPLIGSIDLTILLRAPSEFDRSMAGFKDCKGFFLNALDGSDGVLMNDGRCLETNPKVRASLDWVIVGGESGPKARPMHPDWARKIRDDCAASGVAFFFKQWGEFFPGDDLKVEEAWTEHLFNDDVCVARVGKKRAGRKLDGKSHNEFPKAKAGEARAA